MRNTAQDRARIEGEALTDDDIAASAETANGSAQPNVDGNVPSRRRSIAHNAVSAVFHPPAGHPDYDGGPPLTVTTLTGERHEAYVAFTTAAAELDRAQVALNEAQTVARAAFDRLRKSTTL